MIIVLILTLSLQAPAGWDATYLRVQQLVLDRKTTEAIAILEGVLKSSPGFDPARYELADIHRTLAMEAALQQPRRTRNGDVSWSWPLPVFGELPRARVSTSSSPWATC